MRSAVYTNALFATAVFAAAVTTADAPVYFTDIAEPAHVTAQNVSGDELKNATFSR